MARTLSVAGRERGEGVELVDLLVQIGAPSVRRCRDEQLTAAANLWRRCLDRSARPPYTGRLVLARVRGQPAAMPTAFVLSVARASEPRRPGCSKRSTNAASRPISSSGP